MSKLERRLHQHTFLPGTERYTKPEEIQALGKFLRKVKETQEEHTELGEDNLALPDKNGNSKPILPDEFTTLPGQRISVAGVVTEVSELEKGREPLKDRRPQIELRGDREELRDRRETRLETEAEELRNTAPSLSLEETVLGISTGGDVALEVERVRLGENESPEIESLPSQRLEIGGKETEISLSEARDTLPSSSNTPEETLDGTITPIPREEGGGRGGNIESLPDTTPPGIKKPTDIPLEDERKEITKPQDLPLETEKETIKAPKDVSLEKEKLGISKPKDLPLEKSKETLEDKRKTPDLEDTRVTIKAPKDLSLEDEVLGIDGGKEILELPDESEALRGKETPNLPDKREDISPEDTLELPGGRKTINPGELDSLRGEVDTLHGPKDPQGLEEGMETITPRPLSSLSEDRIGLQGKETPSLSEVQKTISPKETSELSEGKETIQERETPNLPDKREDIQGGKVISELPGERETINPQETTDLPEGKIDLTGDPEVTLEDGKETIQAPEVDSMREDLISLNTPDGPSELPGDSIGIDSPETPELSETLLRIQGGTENDLPKDSLYLPGEVGEMSLEDEIERLDGPRDIDGLEDTVLRIEGGEDLELPGDRLDISPEDKTPVLPGDSISRPGEDIPIENLEEITPPASSLPPGDNGYLTSGPESLEDHREDLEKSDDPELSETRLDITSPEDIPLEDHQERIEDSRTPSLEDTQEKLEDSRKELSLEDYLDDLEDSRNPFLEDYQEERPGEDKEVSLLGEETLDEITPPEDLDLVDSSLKIEGGEEIESLPDDEVDLDIPEDEIPLEDHVETLSLRNKLLKISQDKINLEPEKSLIETPEDFEKYTGESTEEITEEAPDNLSDGKIDIPVDSSQKSSEPEEKIRGEGEVPDYELPKIGWGNFWSGNALNPSTYLRWAAEKTVGQLPLRGSAKQKIIDETLSFLVWGREELERLAKSNRDRLPGDDYGVLSDLANGSMNVKKAAGSVLGAVGSALSNTTVDHRNPVNRPTKINGKFRQNHWESPGQKVLDTLIDVHPGTADFKPPGFWKKVGDNLMGALTVNSEAPMDQQRQFTDYILGDHKLGEGSREFGMGVTLSDLISKDKNRANDLESFREALRNSRFITTPEKFTSTSSSTNYMTLDSNHVWEIYIRPYAGKMNGFKTWLPSFLEIDYQNKKAFNYTTTYSRGWLPITGFELQEKKVTSRDLPLFDGSISYPVGMEFTNELRITFADDSLKSLKRYFDLCAKVSTYMSNIHKPKEILKEVKPSKTITTGLTFGDFGKTKGIASTLPVFDFTRGNETTETVTDWGEDSIYDKPIDTISDITNPTVYLEQRIHPGLYKNLSFLISLYILTPQYGTIKKCNLLCTLKDYMIENQGETDSSPTELSVTFSIVGENPVDNFDLGEVSSFQPPPKTGQTDRTATGFLDNLDGVMSVF